MKNSVKYVIGVLITVIVFAVIWFGYNSFATQANTTDRTLTMDELASKTENNQNRDNQLIIGLDASFPPMTFTSGNGELVGFDIDLAKKALGGLGKELVFKPVVWEEKEKDLENKKIDLIWSGVNITDERKKIFTFSDSYFNNSIIGVVAADSNIVSLEDIAGAVVGNQKGAVFITDLVKAYKNSQGRGVGNIKTEFEDVPAALLALLEGKADVIFGDKTAVLYYVSRSPNTFRVLPGDLKKNGLGVAMRKGDKEMQKKINEALNKLKSDGSYQQVYAKWFGNSN